MPSVCLLPSALGIVPEVVAGVSVSVVSTDFYTIVVEVEASVTSVSMKIIYLAMLHVSCMAKNPDKENSIFASSYSIFLLKSIK